MCLHDPLVTWGSCSAWRAKPAFQPGRLRPDSRLGQAIRIADYIFTGAFALEALLKIITYGFAFTGSHAYIRNGWNVLDFTIVLVG